MSGLKEVRNRIKSVSSTQQITKAMKLVSANKLRKAQTAILQMRPYAKKLEEILQSLSDSVDSPALMPYFEAREKNKILLIVVTSDRGLCGAFNANVIKKARNLVDTVYAEQAAKGALTIMPIGKKGFEFFSKYKKLKVDTSFQTLFANLNGQDSFKALEAVLELYLKREYDAVEVVYNQFKNAATQILTHSPILPVPAALGIKSKKTDFIFEPGKAEILEDLVPRSLKTQFYKVLLDSFAAEHGARMVAMDNATENAGDLLNNLRLQYNQARQASITKELAEIVGGAAAMAG